MTRDAIAEIEYEFETWAFGLERAHWGIHDCPFEALGAINAMRDVRGHLPTQEHEEQAETLREFCDRIEEAQQEEMA